VPSLDRTIAGRISRSASEVDPATRTMHVEVDVPNPDRLLVPGMYAEAVIVLDRVDDAVAVPTVAIDRTDNTTSVLVVTASHVLERRPVTLGLETADAVEVTKGLAPGDLVVTGTRSQLRPGETVDPKLAAAAPASGGR